MKIRNRIVIELTEKGDLAVKEMVDILDVSKQAIHKALLQLLDQNLITKFGRTPTTIYRLNIQKNENKKDRTEISLEKQSFLNDNFLLISEIGVMMEGLDGFERWCNQRKLPLEKTIDEFIKTKEKYKDYYDENGIVKGKEKLMNTSGYDEIILDEVYYLDFYAIERFGKTKLGTMLHYAKQGQNKFLMKLLLAQLKPKLNKLLLDGNYDAVGFVPPTIRREVQLMKYLETHLKIDLPKVSIQKISGIIPVPQKSLNKLDERINNAENTFAINETVKYHHILLIDDAIGSGSTLNQIAGKIKRKGIAQKITGLAIVGSFKGFDVVTDV